MEGDGRDGGLSEGSFVSHGGLASIAADDESSASSMSVADDMREIETFLEPEDGVIVDHTPHTTWRKF